MKKLPHDLLDLMKKGREDPVFMVENVIGMATLWEKQKEILRSIRDNTRTTVRSCNGAGKTFTAANAVAWFLPTFVNSIVISTAPTTRQVRELLWQEINNIVGKSKYPLGGKPLTVSWTMGAKWFALGLSTDDPNRFQGFHAENILGVIDEAAGVDAPIFEAMDAILTSENARLLLIGNPTETSGAFFNSFSSPLYNKIHISAFDTPNFTEGRVVYPALITPRWVEERKREWGEDSPAYYSRVLGEFPVMGVDTMIPLAWVMRSKEREREWKDTDKCIMAIDVARFGDDESSVAVRRGKALTRLDIKHKNDIHELSMWAKRVADIENPEFIKVDVVGNGAGVADNLRAWGYPAVDFVAQARAWEPEKFINRRTEAWYNVREKFRRNEIDIMNDDVLIGQLTAPTYDFDVSGRFRLESKEKIKGRGLKSPDRADSVVMVFEADENLDTVIIKDPSEYRAKPGTVAAILQELERKEGDEFKWHRMAF